MSLEEAFKLLQSLCDQLKLSKQEHAMVDQALAVIKQATDK